MCALFGGAGARFDPPGLQTRPGLGAGAAPRGRPCRNDRRRRNARPAGFRCWTPSATWSCTTPSYSWCSACWRTWRPTTQCTGGRAGWRAPGVILPGAGRGLAGLAARHAAFHACAHVPGACACGAGPRALTALTAETATRRCRPPAQRSIAIAAGFGSPPPPPGAAAGMPPAVAAAAVRGL